MLLLNNIEVKVLDESHSCPAGMMMFLAKLTQRGHNIQCMDDLIKLYEASIHKHKSAVDVAHLPHGTIKRFTPITIAIVGASRRYLAQARTHQVGMNYVSASLQYSDYSGKASFVVPYEILEQDTTYNLSMRKAIPPEDRGPNDRNFHALRMEYLDSCNASMKAYEELARFVGNDAAGYAAPQGLRNILIMQANHESWMHMIRTRGCNRNTTETQYVTTRIWEELLKTEDGEEMFYYAGPDCAFGMCREGRMSCGNSLRGHIENARAMNVSVPRLIIDTRWPLIGRS